MRDAIEQHFIDLLYALQKDGCLPGMIPGETLYWAEVQARLVAEVLQQLDTYRRWRERGGQTRHELYNTE